MRDQQCTGRKGNSGSPASWDRQQFTSLRNGRHASRAPGPPATTARPGHRHASADLDPAPAARARRLTREVLTRWQLDAYADDAVAIAAEIVANAIAAAIPPQGSRPAIIFTLHHRPPEPRITVWDNGPGHPAPPHGATTPRPAGGWPSSTPSPPASGAGGLL